MSTMIIGSIEKRILKMQNDIIRMRSHLILLNEAEKISSPKNLE